MMKSTTLLAIPVVLICMAATPAQPEEAPVAPSKFEETTAAAPDPDWRDAIPALELEPDPDEHDEYMGHLAGWLLEDIIEHWTPAVKQVPAVFLPAVAYDVARAVVHEPEDPGHCGHIITSDGRKHCLWGVPGWNSDHAKAVLLAAVGYWEGARYAKSVDNGDCNDPAWRADPANAALIHIMGNCDGGRAHSIFQIWPRVGPASDSPINVSCDKDAVAVRYTAARCALQILRMSMMAKSDLTGYTGETPPLSWKEQTMRSLDLDTGEGSWRQKSTVRLEFAKKALKKHPWH